MSEFDDMGFFSPLFGREPHPDDEPYDPTPDERPAMWGAMDDDAQVDHYSIAHFLPHLSKRTQVILTTLDVQTVGDLLALSAEQICACDRGNETVIVEIHHTILEFKGLSLRGRTT